MTRNSACARGTSAYDARMKTRALVFLATVVVLAGCGRQERVREIDWAKAALARNPAYEIVATDESAGVFTVKDTSSGEVSVVRVDDLVAAPAPPRTAKPALATPAVVEPNGVAEVQPTEAAPDPALAAAQTTEAEEVVATPAASGTPLVEGPGYSITRGEPRENPATPSSARRADPIICQGERLMRIDGETLDFTGDALIAEAGCDLYISNASIRAGGVGLIARQARVHIVNSSIHGSAGSYEASEGAELYLSSSTFTGIGRRFDTATTTDLGGNDYKSH